MLPAVLQGPGRILYGEPYEAFVRAAAAAYPSLDRDFVLQICFEHPQLFDELLPGFDPGRHITRKIEKRADWVRDNVRYRDNIELDFWWGQFDDYLTMKRPRYEIFEHMVREKTWPFPPVIIECSLAQELGAPASIGTPYHLIEGTHRVSYLKRMLALEMVEASSLHPIILLQAS